MALEETRGVPAAGPYHNVISSDAAICWDATLLPFADELPSGCDWLGFGRFADPTGELNSLADDWIRRDQRNGVLEQEQPVSFVRDAII
ncbi:MAG TPA: hypothetical protein VKA15_04400, partial [Isosphaeraceae bacterium]|nr:hypothetical protein [Isosphaeraceae bacterium]